MRGIFLSIMLWFTFIFIPFNKLSDIMHLFITGISGFIGRRAAERALEKGWTVSGMEANETAAQQTANKLGIQVFTGDVSRAEDCNNALQKADIVLHTAAIVKETGDWNRFREVNVDGTVNIARAAKRAGAKHFIHLSSVMVYGFHYPAYVTEEGPVNGDNNPYCQTKIESENALRRLENDGMTITIVRPGDVYGPGSVPWVIRPLEMMHQMQFFHIDGGKGYFNYVYVDNLLNAIFLIIEKKAAGTFNVTDGAITNKEYFSALGALAGVSFIPDLPSMVIRPLSRVIEQVASWQKKEPLINQQAIRYMQRPHPYSSEKIRQHLGYQPEIDLAKGLALTRTWLLQERPDLLR
jgi:nucleoside-diphosphate-sugar epimerase